MNMSPLSITLDYAFKGWENCLDVLGIRSSLCVLQAVFYTEVNGLECFISCLDARALHTVLLPYNINSNSGDLHRLPKKSAEWNKLDIRRILCWTMEIHERAIWDKMCFSVNSTLLWAKCRVPSLALLLSYQHQTRQHRINTCTKGQGCRSNFVWYFHISVVLFYPLHSFNILNLFV